jgi:glutamyl-tRNA synthetase
MGTEISSSKVVTRFAPSPTGFLHCGSVRTALYSWLYARQQGGSFILRIEDTDRERSTPEACQAILEGMEWLGLSWDQGPFYQTQRMERYQEVLADFLDRGYAYKCVCTKERLAEMRATQIAAKEKPRYDGHCRHNRETHIQKDAAYVLRFKNPVDGEVVVEDKVHGTVRFAQNELDDLIIARSDGSPTYNFCVVVDDVDMGVTHVIRGDDHLNNTPRQINMFMAMGHPFPVYAHIPMILGKDGARLSKRHGAVSIDQFRQEGIVPDALLNYLVRLGWSHGDQEIFSQEELQQYFSLDRLNRSAAAFDPEKLLWVNQQHLKNGHPEKWVPYWQEQADRVKVNWRGQGPSVLDIITVQAARCKTLQEMVEKSRFFYDDNLEADAYEKMPVLLKKALPSEEERRNVHVALEACLTVWRDPDFIWSLENLHQSLGEEAAKKDLGLGKLAQPLRILLSGGTVSPPMDQTLYMMGRERVFKRMERLNLLVS